MCLSFAALSLQSTKALPDGTRRPNEDALLQDFIDGTHIFVIADGNDMAPMMGRPLAPSNVSRLACETAAAGITQERTARDAADALGDVVAGAIAAVCEKIAGDPLCQFQSTTLTVLTVTGNAFACAHVGDGGLYQYRRATKSVSCITPPPLPGADLFIDPATRFRLAPVRCTGTLASGDWLLLTTDGLINLWGGDLEAAFAQVAMRGDPPAACIADLFARARAVNRHDDLSCFLIRMEPTSDDSTDPGRILL